VVNQKREPMEAAAEVLDRARRAVDVLGAERVLLTPDCGFATFADNPVASSRAAEASLAAVVAAAAVLRRG
jgi:5-methyltetrahydropteroyltriglutamate--homocysteine methyltransferase